MVPEQKQTKEDQDVPHKADEPKPATVPERNQTKDQHVPHNKADKPKPATVTEPEGEKQETPDLSKVKKEPKEPTE